MNTSLFLSPAHIRQNAADAGLDQLIVEQLLALAQRVAGEPALLRCTEQLYAQTYEHADDAIDPPAESLFGDAVNKLYLLLAVDAVRQLRVVHRQRGIPEAITRETFAALPMSARRFAEANGGATGLEDWVLRYWFNVVASGDLHRLGRMEFILQPFYGNLRVYRHRQSRRVQALAENGVRFTTDGHAPFQIDATTATHYGWNHDGAPQGEWTATLIEDDESVIGTPISPYGLALPAVQQLAKSEWELQLRNGDTVIDMHIPNYMPLRLDLLHASLQRALDFFPTYYPQRDVKAFVCESWIFNTQLADMLPASSNLVAFQRQGYLFPLPADGAEGMYFIFGNWLIDLDTAPQDTQLRRAVIAHLRAGGKLRNGGFLLLPEDVDRFGQQPYRI
jgi:hypothetical protein